MAFVQNFAKASSRKTRLRIWQQNDRFAKSGKSADAFSLALHRGGRYSVYFVVCPRPVLNH
jgi:hypothetical protein